MAAPALDPAAIDPDGDPMQIARGPDGNAWVALSGNSQAKELARINPSGTLDYFDLPGAHAIVGLAAGPSTAGGPDDRLWLTYNGGVIRFDPAAGTGTDHPIASINTAQGITRDADGNLWVVDSADGLVKVAPNGTLIEDVPVAGKSGRGIALGSDGRVWWVDFNGGDVLATTTAAPHTTTPFDVGSGNPQQIAAGPAGQLGYASPQNEVGRITTDGAFTNTTATLTDSFGITYANDGAYWTAQFLPDKVARLTPAGEYTQPISLPAGAGPRYIAGDSANNLWVTAATNKMIYRITGVEAPPADTGNTGNTGDPGTGTTTTPPPPPPRDTIAPVLTGASVNTRTRKLSLTLSEPAGLRLQVERRRTGRRSGNRCVPVTRRNRAKKKCTFYSRVRTLQAPGLAGANKLSLGKRLAPGAYRVVITATDPSGNVAKRPVRFTVPKPR